MNKLFTEKQVSTSAIFGGPIPPGILIYLNYRSLGEKENARFSLMMTFILTIGFFLLMFSIPEQIMDKIPGLVFSSFYALIVYLFFRHYMAKMVEQGFVDGKIKASNWTVVGAVMGGSIVNVILIFGIAMIQPAFPGEKVDFSGNEVYYSGEATEVDAEVLASNLFTIEYFGEGFGNAVHLEKSKSSYGVTIPIEKEFWSDSDVNEIFSNLRLVLESEYALPTKLTFEHYTLSGNTETKTL